MEYLNSVPVQPGIVKLSLTEVSMFDSIYDPFGAATDRRMFLNFYEFTSVEYAIKEGVQTIY